MLDGNYCRSGLTEAQSEGRSDSSVCCVTSFFFSFLKDMKLLSSDWFSHMLHIPTRK